MKKELDRKKFIALFILFLILLFQNILEQYIWLFKFFDEALIGILFLIYLYKQFIVGIKINEEREELIKNNIMIIIAMIIILTVGLSGNIIYKYQTIPAVIADIILVFKGFITYVLVSMIFCDISFEKYHKYINNTLRVIVIISTSMILINYPLNIFPIKDIRYGLPSQRLFFSEPTYLATVAISIIILLTFLMKSYSKNIYYILAMCFVVASTLRSKAIIFIAVYLILYYLIILKELRLNKKIIIIISIAAILVGGVKIGTYLSNTDWARPALMLNSLKISSDHFPIGGGFATFATWNSGVYYSPLYYTYNLNNTWGLQPDFYMFVGDTYWPAILGQFGYIGLISVIFILSRIYKNITFRKCKYKYFQQLSILIYLLILSTAETSFMSPMAPLLCLLLAI